MFKSRNYQLSKSECWKQMDKILEFGNIFACSEFWRPLLYKWFCHSEGDETLSMWDMTNFWNKWQNSRERVVMRMSRDNVCRRVNSEWGKTKCFKKRKAMTDMPASWSSRYKRKAFPGHQEGHQGAGDICSELKPEY